MSQNVLFVHGSGSGAYEEDGKLVASLRDTLGDGYVVRYPEMPNEDEPRYQAWQAQITRELAAFNGSAILVGHSFGGPVLLKYLSEEAVAAPVAGIFLLAAPFLNADADWQTDEYALRDDFAAQLASIPHIFLYHSRDDDTVPFAHLGLYSAKLPGAIVRTFDERGHQFHNDLHEVREDIATVLGFVT